METNTIKNRLKKEVARLNLEYYRTVAAMGMCYAIFYLDGTFCAYEINGADNAYCVKLNPEIRTKQYLLEKLFEEVDEIVAY